MRIAIVGSHRVGKTSLAEALAQALPGHERVPEPYEVLEEQGEEFADPPSLEDFESQLECALQLSQEAGANAVFDRCPLDILAYLVVHEDADGFYLEDWQASIREAVATLDLVVYVPIEDPDVVPVPARELPLRAEADMVVQDLVVADGYGFGQQTFTVTGTIASRVEQVLARIRV